MQLETLEQFYLEIEASKAAALAQTFDITARLIPLRDALAKTDERAAKQVQIEIDCFSFTLKEGELTYLFAGTNTKGEREEYPTLARFDDAAFDYLATRWGSVLNSFSKARYAHVLWISPHRQLRYAESAITCYLALAKDCEEEDAKRPEDHMGHQVLFYTQAAFEIALRIQKCVEAVRDEILRLVQCYNWQSQCAFGLRAGLIELMLINRKVFTDSDLAKAEAVCWLLHQDLFGKSNIHGAIDILVLGEKVAARLGSKKRDWARRQAECYEELIRQRGIQDLASMGFCQSALELYKQIEDQIKFQELEQKFTEIRKASKLSLVKHNFDITEYVNHCETRAEQLAKLSSEEILKTLSLDKSLLPTYEGMKLRAQEQAKSAPLTALITKSVFDFRGNPAQVFSTPEERERHDLLWNYKYELDFKFWLINQIFIKTISAGKLSFENMLKFFHSHSWFSNDLQRSLPNGETYTYNWLNLLAPGLHEYFSRMDYYVTARSLPDFVLTIDSLTLKLEGLLRELCERCQIPTFYQKREKGGKVIREKDVQMLLAEKGLEKLFDQDELLFLKFLLVEKAGYNMRHDIAHALLPYEHYNVNRANLLILAILKIGKFKFSVRSETQGETMTNKQ